jgi:hypothetical protein
LPQCRMMHVYLPSLGYIYNSLLIDYPSIRNLDYFRFGINARFPKNNTLLVD